MNESYQLSIEHLNEILLKAENKLFNSDKIKFYRSSEWRKKFVPALPGLYALFEDESKLLYIGESGNLRERMNDICRTLNHTFRGKLASKKYGVVKTKGKLDTQTEVLIDLFFDEKLYVTFLEINFGRLEIETHLVTKYQKDLFNSEKKRKLKIELDKFNGT